MSSADCTPFCPKPPPTSQATTRMLSAGMRSETAISICSTWAVCVLDQTVSCPVTGSGITCRPRVSIGEAT